MSPGEGLSHKCFVTDNRIPYPFAFSDCSQGKACLGAHGQQSGRFFISIIREAQGHRVRFG